MWGTGIMGPAWQREWLETACVRRGNCSGSSSGIKYRRRRPAQPLLLLSPLWVGVLGELRGGTTTTPPPPSGKKKKTTRDPTRRHTSYMSSCPFADLVVAVLLAAAILVVVVALACAPRSMHKGLHGWNKSSSMLRDGFGVKYSGFLHIRPCSFLRGD